MIRDLPRRIISLVPSQTELLYDLGLEDKIVGLTKFCVHPSERVKGVSKIGGTKNIKTELIRSLAPDLVIANKEENVKEQVEALAIDFPVWISDVHDLGSALEMINHVGQITGQSTTAARLANDIAAGFDSIEKANGTKHTAAYLIWKDPWMTAGGDTFISKMMGKAGFENIFASYDRYPSISLSDISEKKPDLILLSSEPYPFKEVHIPLLQECCLSAKVIVVDGEMFSWYGSRLLKAPEYYKQLRKDLGLE